MPLRANPTLQDDPHWKFDGWPHAILVTWKDGEEPQRFCGDNWCNGKCRLPALLIPAPHDPLSPLKASGSQVACGAAFQPLRVKAWKGKRVLVPEEHRERLAKLMWW
jgi:hypothetical protein